jgi:hypothetical protein
LSLRQRQKQAIEFELTSIKRKKVVSKVRLFRGGNGFTLESLATNVTDKFRGPRFLPALVPKVATVGRGLFDRLVRFFSERRNLEVH